MNKFEFKGRRHVLITNLFYWRTKLKAALERDDEDEIAYSSLQLNERQKLVDDFTEMYKNNLATKSLKGAKTKHTKDVLKVNEQYKTKTPICFTPTFM